MMKVLVLHGYAENAQLFSKKMKRIQEACSDVCEFHFAEGPLLLALADVHGSSPTLTEQQLRNSAEKSPESAMRTWWRYNHNTETWYAGEEALEAARDLLHREQFDGVLGFSLGAAFAATLCAILEKPHVHPGLLINGEPPQPPFKFAIMVAGRPPKCASSFPLFENGYKIKTPTLHILGNGDIVTPRDMSHMLLNACEKPRLEIHDGGHFVPTTTSFRRLFRSYIKSYDQAAKQATASAESQ